MFHRRPIRALPRLLLLLLFAAGLIAQPVLASAGALHELTAHAGAPHLHADDAAEDATIAGQDGGAPANPDPLHALLHFAHCCGHASAMFFPLIPSAHVVPTRAMPVGDDVAAAAHGFPHGPFRPPIAA